MKFKTKLGGMTAILLLFIAAIGGISILQFRNIEHEIREITKLDIPLSEATNTAHRANLEQEAMVERAIRYSLRDRENQVDSSMENFALAEQEFRESIESGITFAQEGTSYARSESGRKEFENALQKLQQIDSDYRSYSSESEDLFTALESGDVESAIDRREQLDEASLALEQKISSLADRIQTFIRGAVEIANVHAAETIRLITLLAAAALLIGFATGLLITRNVMNQLGIDPSVMNEISSKVADGILDLDTNMDTHKAKGVYLSMVHMVESLRYKADVLEKIANRDLSVNVETASEQDGLGNSLVLMKNSLNEMLSQVNEAVDQVATGSDQVSSASQSLSQGATEQASSLEEINSSITEINGQSTQMDENTTEANSLVKKVYENAESGTKEMDNLLSHIQQINSSADEIKKIVKIIDDIAFQINLLALNANVEAARAGHHGKGFAVVAEEVRNLANRSAKSVKETSSKVEQTVENIEQGTQAAELTGEKLKEIMDGIEKVTSFIEEISQAGREQSHAIEQISTGIEQIDQVTQSNTASAEETASSSEELSSQAQQLKAMVEQFKLDQTTHLPRQITKQQSSAAKTPQTAPSTELGITVSNRPIQKETISEKKMNPEKAIALNDDDFERF